MSESTEVRDIVADSSESPEVMDIVNPYPEDERVKMLRRKLIGQNRSVPFNNPTGFFVEVEQANDTDAISKLFVIERKIPDYMDLKGKSFEKAPKEVQKDDKEKTIIFEKEYGVNIDDFHSVKEIYNFIESKTGKKMKAITEYDNIDELIDKALSN